jgi:hypothetical protein
LREFALERFPFGTEREPEIEHAAYGRGDFLLIVHTPGVRNRIAVAIRLSIEPLAY